MTKKGKNILIGSMLIAVIAPFSSFTLAKYVESKSIGQLVSRDGLENTSFFLNANIWNRGVDSSGNIVDAVYYMWIITGAKTGYLISPSKHVNPVVSGTTMDLYVFEFKYEWAAANRSFIFIRGNPEKSISSFTAFPSTSGDDQVVWNQTHDIPYDSFRNYYCIKQWQVDDDDKNSPYEYNRIDKGVSTLSWGNPAGYNELITE